MMWLVLRRYRAVFLTAAAVAALVAFGLVVQQLTDPARTFPLAWGLLRLLLLGAPMLVGVIIGSALFAHDLRDGTQVFTLTQRVRSSRWWLTVLLGGAVAMVVLVAPLSLLAGVLDAGQRSVLQSPWFEASGLVPVAYGLFTLTLAATLGLLTRNALAAAVVTAVVYVVMLLGLAHSVRMHYLPAESTVSPIIKNGELAVGRIVAADDDSVFVDLDYLDGAGRTVPYESLYGEHGVCSGADPADDCLQNAGVVSSITYYQPASRYWPFQLIESGILLALAGAAVAVGTVGLRQATTP